MHEANKFILNRVLHYYYYHIGGKSADIQHNCYDLCKQEEPFVDLLSFLHDSFELEFSLF
jgi:hypothetical protein